MSLFTTMMDSVATLKRPTIGRDANQGVTQDPFETIVQDEPCSVQPISGNDLMVFGQRESGIDSTIFFTSDIGAAVNDKIETTDALGDVRTFMVRAFERGPYNRVLSPYFCHCQELR